MLSIINNQVGSPIQKSMDQSSFSAPHGLSQSITSFIASYCQGIHQTPFSRLIWSRKSQMRLPHLQAPRWFTWHRFLCSKVILSRLNTCRCIQTMSNLAVARVSVLDWTTLFVSNQDTLRWSRKRPDPNASPTNVRNQNEINPTLRAIKQCW